MKVGYARVSTKDQSIDLQVEALKLAGCEKVFTDFGESGSKFDRKGLHECLAFMREGDTLVILKVDRLARSIRHLLEIVDQLNAKGITLMSISEGMDPSTPTGQAMLSMIGIFAELERNIIHERQKAGIAFAKQNGVHLGRKRAFDEKEIKMVRGMHDKGIPVSDIAKHFNVSRRTVQRYLAKEVHT